MEKENIRSVRFRKIRKKNQYECFEIDGGTWLGNIIMLMGGYYGFFPSDMYRGKAVWGLKAELLEGIANKLRTLNKSVVEKSS